MIKFSRLGQILNLYFEKLPEDVFSTALNKTLTTIGDLDLVDYTTCENIHFDMATGT